MGYNIFVDSNIIVEIALLREKQVDCGKFLLDNYSHQSVSILSVHLLFHFVRKHKGDIDSAKNMLSQLEILNMGRADYELALEIQADSDFEDALQVACCLNHRCDKFLTLDKRLAKRYSKLVDIITV